MSYVGPRNDPYDGVIGNAGQVYPAEPLSHLCVSDIERLAKAGVAMDIGRVLPVQDFPQEPQPATTAEPLADAIWDRWLRSRKARQPQGSPDYGIMQPYQLLATQHGDKVWVSVHPTNFNYEPFQLQDDACIFPSDGLMAQLALWERHHP